MAVVIIVTGYRPEKVFDWWLENAAALTFLAVLGITYRRLPLSDLSYLLIFVYLSVHEWGAEYKYSDVPLGEWMKPWLGTTRNHYDRVMHFSYGLLLSYPMQEWFMRVVGVTSRWRYLLPVEIDAGVQRLLRNAGGLRGLGPHTRARRGVRRHAGRHVGFAEGHVHGRIGRRHGDDRDRGDPDLAPSESSR